MRTVDLVVAESFEVLKLWKSTFSAKSRVMAMVICILRVKGRRAKVQIGCPLDRKVLRKDLVAVSICGHLGSGLKETLAQDEIFCHPRITGHCYFWRMGI
jgi:hypothetical protein